MSEINLKGELKKGYLMFRAFEHGIKLAEELENLEGAIQGKKKELDEVTIKLKGSADILSKELDKIAHEVEIARNKEIEDLEQYKKDKALERAALDKKLASINDAIKKAEGRVAAKTKEAEEIDGVLAQRKVDLDKFNKEIEETKAKFRGMF